MKCIICGVKPQDYTKRDGTPVKGFNLNMLAANPNVYGYEMKDTFVNCNSPLYGKYMSIFDDIDLLLWREVNVEWDVQTYGTKSVKILVSFEMSEKDKHFELIEKGA